MGNLLAYIEPATTALILQILAGVLVVFGVVLGIWWTKITTYIKGVWARIFKKGGAAESEKIDEAIAEILDDELINEVASTTADEEKSIGEINE